jgi:hypothetical protein
LSDQIKLDVVDRRDLIRGGALAGGGFLAGGVLFSGFTSPAEAQTAISRRRSRANDIRIGNYALTLEYLEAGFYDAALESGVIQTPEVRKFAEVVYRHEAAHVTALRTLIGRRRAVRRPDFDFSGALGSEADFRTTAQALEDTGVAAYAGQGPYILQLAVLRPALGIHSVEARHAAWIRFLNGGGAPNAEDEALPAPQIVDEPLSQRRVLRIVERTGFLGR